MRGLLLPFHLQYEEYAGHGNDSMIRSRTYGSTVVMAGGENISALAISFEYTD
jgi:hypothetical protein